jgi:hypothetical protein
MKVIAHYDADGTIHAFMRIAAPEGTTVAVAPEPGLLADEVDMAGVAAHDGGSVEALDPS